MHLFRKRPKRVEPITFDDLSGHMAAAPASSVVAGLDPAGRPVLLDFEEHRNLAVSAAAGGGASVLLRLLIAQALHNGARVVVLDPKHMSQQWCKGLDGVTYARTGAEAHQAVTDLYGVMKERQTDLSATYPRIVVVTEVQGVLMRKLRDHDDKAGRNRVALGNFRGLLANGPLVNIHLVSGFHLLTAQALGAGDRSDLAHYGARVAGRLPLNGLRTFAPEVEPVRWVPPQRGAFRLLDPAAGEWREFRAGFPTAAEAREWATGVRA